MSRRQGFRRLFEGKTEDGTCWNCQKALIGRQTRYCCEDCSLAYWGKFNWGSLRLQALKRDNFTCLLCGYSDPTANNRYRRRKQNELTVDHIIPIADGGEEFDINNVRTLCYDCHKKVTREWHAAKRAKNTKKQSPAEAAQTVSGAQLNMFAALQEDIEWN